MVSKTIKVNVGDKVSYRLLKDGYKTVADSINITVDTDNTAIYNLQPSPEVYKSNLNSGLDTSGNNPPVIVLNDDFTLPDGSVISKDNKYLFYKKNEGVYRVYNIEPIHSGQFTVVGQDVRLSDTQWISNQSSSSYLLIDLSEKFTDDKLNTFEIIMKAGVNTSYSWQPMIINSDFQLFKYTNGKMGLCDITGDICNFAVSNGDNLWARGIYDGTTYTAYYLKDSDYKYTVDTLPTIESGKWSVGGTSTNFRYDFTKPFRTRNNDSYPNQYWYGAIDLSNMKIIANDKVIWQYGDFKRNYLIRGDVKVENGIASGFKSDSYISTTITGAYSLWSNMEIQLKMKLNSVSGFFIGNKQDQRGIRISSEQNNCLCLLIGNGSWFNINNRHGTHPLETGKWYWVKVTIDHLTNIAKLYLSEDGTNYIEDISYNIGDVMPVFDNEVIGGGDEGNPYIDAIDLNETYFKLNDYYTYRPIEDELRKQRVNFNTGGNVTLDSNGDCANFTNNSYLQLPKITGDFTFITNIKTGVNTISHPQVILSPGNNSNNVLCIPANTNNLQWWSDASGANYNKASVFNLNTNYWIYFSIIKNVLTCYYMEDDGKYQNVDSLPDPASNIDWNLAFTGAQPVSTFVTNTNVLLGRYSSDTNFWTGSINAAKTKLIVNDQDIYLTYDSSLKYEVINGILDFIDEGNANTYTLYNTDRGIIINNGAEVDCKWKEYIQLYNIDKHDTYRYENNKWIESTIVTVTVNTDIDCEDSEIIFEGVEA